MGPAWRRWTASCRPWRTSRTCRRSGAAVLGAVRHLSAGAGGRRRRDDGAGLPGHGQPHGCGRRPRADGHGGHPVHGQGVRRPPQPGGQHRLLAAGGLPLATRARLRRRPAGRSRPGRLVPPGRRRCLGDRRRDLSGGGLFRRGRVRDGGRAHPWPGQRHPRHGLGRPEPRSHRGHRRGCLHRAGRPVGGARSPVRR